VVDRMVEDHHFFAAVEPDTLRHKVTILQWSWSFHCTDHHTRAHCILSDIDTRHEVSVLKSQSRGGRKTLFWDVSGLVKVESHLKQKTKGLGLAHFQRQLTEVSTGNRLSIDLYTTLDAVHTFSLFMPLTR